MAAPACIREGGGRARRTVTCGTISRMYRRHGLSHSGRGSRAQRRPRVADLSARFPTEDKDGLTPEELPVVIARTARDKYKHVTPMGPGAKVTGFMSNLLGEDDEEDVVRAATGGPKASEDE